MIKSLFFSAAVFSAQSAFCDAIRMTCITEPFTTSVVVFPEGTKTTIRVIHHNGTEYMPLTSASVTPHDLANLAMASDELKKLGSQYELHLDPSKCRLVRNTLVDCYGEANDVINGNRVSWISLQTSKTTQESPLLATPLHKILVNLSMTVNGKAFDFAMSYNPKNCVAGQTEETF